VPADRAGPDHVPGPGFGRAPRRASCDGPTRRNLLMGAARRAPGDRPATGRFMDRRYRAGSPSPGWNSPSCSPRPSTGGSRPR
jgi:hypothetical protein